MTLKTLRRNITIALTLPLLLTKVAHGSQERWVITCKMWTDLHQTRRSEAPMNPTEKRKRWKHSIYILLGWSASARRLQALRNYMTSTWKTEIAIKTCRFSHTAQRLQAVRGGTEVAQDTVTAVWIPCGPSTFHHCHARPHRTEH